MISNNIQDNPLFTSNFINLAPNFLYLIYYLAVPFCEFRDLHELCYCLLLLHSLSTITPPYQGR